MTTQSINRPQGAYYWWQQGRKERNCAKCAAEFWDVDSVLDSDRGLIHEACHPDYREYGTENTRFKIF